MATDRGGFDPEALRERIDPEALRESVEERIDTEDLRESVDETLDPATVRERLDAFYVRYFMPPSVTGEFDETGAEDVEYAEFDITEWLGERDDAGPTAPPAEPRVVSNHATAEEANAAESVEYDAFDFQAWLADGEDFEPIVVGDEPDATTAETPESGDSTLFASPTLGIHPAKAATFALFLAVVTVTALTVVGYLPALGPATGL